MNDRLKVGVIAAVVLTVSGVGWAAWRGLSADPVSPAPLDHGLTGPEVPPPAPPESEHFLLAQADAALARGAYAEAKRLYLQVLQHYPAAPSAAQAQQRLGEANLKLLLSPAMRPEAPLYTVQPGDTLSKIARKTGVTVELLKISNGLSSDLIRAGQPLKIPRAQFSLIVDKSQNLLTLKNGEEVVKVYRCSTGAGGITPTGEFRITSRLVDPIWKGLIPPGDPENPLGSRWLGFDMPEYGIHGTNEPETVGQPVTKGCVRLLNSDVEELYNLLPEGTLVLIVE